MYLTVRAVLLVISLLAVGKAQYQPTSAPYAQPTSAPYTQPTSAPLTQPTPAPYVQPIFAPLTQPTPAPYTQPTFAPQALQGSATLKCPLFQFQHAVIPVSPGSNEYKITFTAQTTVNLAFVDVHWQIVRAGGGQELETNERMTKLGATSFERLLGMFPIRLNAGDCIHYSFTYCALADSLRIDCDTDKFSSCPSVQQSALQQPSYQARPIPAPITAQLQSFNYQAQPTFTPAPLVVTPPQFHCPLFQVQHAVVPIPGTDQWKIQFNAMTTMDVALVDVHWQIQHTGEGGLTEMINERMTKLSTSSFERAVSTLPIRLNPGDCVHYWFTYCVGTPVGRVDCDTERFSSCAIPQPTQQSLHASFQPQPQFQPLQASY
jgi:uncharacterized protein with PIN domain